MKKHYYLDLNKFGKFLVNALGTVACLGIFAYVTMRLFIEMGELYL